MTFGLQKNTVPLVKDKTRGRVGERFWILHIYIFIKGSLGEKLPSYEVLKMQ